MSDVTLRTGAPGVVGQGLAELRRGGPRKTLQLAVPYLRARWRLRHATQLGAARLWGGVRLINSGTITIGNRCRLDGRTVRLELVAFPGGVLTIGDGTYINYGTNISATERVSIGSNCDIGQYSIIMDNDQHDIDDHSRMGQAAPVTIEDDVWLGARVIVLRGTTIGRGSVIGANSVVKGKIPPYSLAAGSPARVIRSLK
jgi:maltose O-acetyltransferase